MSNFADDIMHSTDVLKARSPGSEHGIVFDNEDPDELGRVRVQMVWHQPGEATGWIHRLTGGGNGYGSSDSIPQKGEMVTVVFLRGDLHHPVYIPATWTIGGMGPRAAMPPSLPPGGKTKELYVNPNHEPAESKYKIWLRRSISGFITWVGEGLDWMRWRSPKGLQVDIEHDVPVGGKTKADAKPKLPYHRTNLTTPTGHQYEVIEWHPNAINNIELRHTNNMQHKFLHRPPGDTPKQIVHKLDGHRIDWVKGIIEGAPHLSQKCICMQSEGGHYLLMDDVNQLVYLYSYRHMFVHAQEDLNLISDGYMTIEVDTTLDTHSGGDNTITTDDNFTVTAKKNVNITAYGTVTVSGATTFTSTVKMLKSLEVDGGAVIGSNQPKRAARVGDKVLVNLITGEGTIIEGSDTVFIGD